MTDTGIVEIRGKKYKTVAKRVQEFRETHPGYSITSDVSAGEQLVTVRSVIADETGRVIATGHAEECRESSAINRTSAVENCETSAVGRALAFFGLGGHELASADELVEALRQQCSPGSPPKPVPTAFEKATAALELCKTREQRVKWKAKVIESHDAGRLTGDEKDLLKTRGEAQDGSSWLEWTVTPPDNKRKINTDPETINSFVED